MRVSKTRETGLREGYGYDLGDRLTRVDYGTAKRVDYSLDLLGNRVLEDTTTSPSTGLARTSGVFNSFNQLTSTSTLGAATSTYAYDLNGNLLTETKTPSGLPAEVTTYAWDRDNRLRSVTPPAGMATSYSYDPNGMRTQRVDATGTTRYLVDGRSVMQELDGANMPTVVFFNDPQRFDEVLAYQRAGATEYPLTDALGSVYSVSDATGAVVHRYDFDVYGARADLGGSVAAIDVGFTGRRQDANGLVEHWNRQRRPQLGGWLQADPLGMVDGPNRYVFVSGAPTQFTDPSGLYRTTVDAYAESNLAGFLALLEDLGVARLPLLALLAALAVSETCPKDKPRTPAVYYRGMSMNDLAELSFEGIIKSKAFRQGDIIDAISRVSPQAAVDHSTSTVWPPSPFVGVTTEFATAKYFADGYSNEFEPTEVPSHVVARLVTLRPPFAQGSPAEQEWLFPIFIGPMWDLDLRRVPGP